MKKKTDFVVCLASKSRTRRRIHFEYAAEKDNGTEKGKRNIGTSLWDWRGVLDKWFVTEIGSIASREMQIGANIGAGTRVFGQ